MIVVTRLIIVNGNHAVEISLHIDLIVLLKGEHLHKISTHVYS